MRYAWLVMLVVGCYQAPDYGGTQFKCDADHPCPAGQPCVAGVCNGSGGSASVDAATNGAGVQCGATACAANQKCCFDFLGGPSCVATSVTCAGIAATCDGVEDCSGGNCCEGAGSQQIACAPTCATQTICLDTADCINASGSQCCMGVGGINEPWGRCFSACP